MNLPNQLTVLRILLIPIFVILMMLSEVGAVWSFFATFVFIVASVTDYLDGYLARKYHLVTAFGKFADPLADKMLVMSAFICLVSLGKVSMWIACVIVCRELAVTGLRLLLVQDGEVMAAALPGKIKTATQMLAIIFLIMNDFPLQMLPFSIGTILLYSCLVATVYSGVDYFLKNKHVFLQGM